MIASYAGGANEIDLLALGFAHERCMASDRTLRPELAEDSTPAVCSCQAVCHECIRVARRRRMLRVRIAGWHGG